MSMCKGSIQEGPLRSAGLEKAVNLSSDPADRQATIGSRAAVQEFLATAEVVMHKRKALDQRADSIRQALAALEIPLKRDDKASLAKGFYVANAGDVPSAGTVQANAARRLPMPVARPPISGKNDTVAEAEIGSPPDQNIAKEYERSVELFQRAGEAALLVMTSPSEATLAAHAKAMQAVDNLAPPSEAAARLVVLARDAAAAARDVLEAYIKWEGTSLA
jgi:hypothetical protein